MLYLSVSADSIMASSAEMCEAPNMPLSSEKTRSAVAEFGVHDAHGERGKGRAVRHAAGEEQDGLTR